MELISYKAIVLKEVIKKMLKQIIERLNKFPPIIKVSLIFIVFGLLFFIALKIGEVVGRLIYDIVH
ncbi:hypothetical protein OTK01_002551 [Caldicellulosiruptor acetigenus]|uniref:hypothetical protein n=1 Tax=Caldicellulosiruptor acetigenus TaxID=301953 RepID=UPI0005545C5B|nr:hypothetical protein [Caldicellulosiruptor acetigenus]WAM36162.1 hypothetical protein OTK01_002551 [Caldicellulosiruptor acetigenus]